MNQNTKFQYIKQIMYDLEKLYGFPIVLYNITGYVLDTKTGLKTVTKDVYRINKALVLPGNLDVRYKALLGVQKDFAYGGQIGQEDRYFIVNRKRVPNSLVITDDCYITYDNKRYDTIKVEGFEHLRAFILFGKHVVNSSIDQVIDRSVKNNITTNQTSKTNAVRPRSVSSSIDLTENTVGNK